MSIVIAVLVFGLIVVIHELGHFMAAKKCGVMVEEFALGMGPVLLKKRFGETVFSLRALPIGGFCKMLGEDAASEDSRAFNNKKVSRRAIILAAGAGMNFVLAFAAFLAALLFNGFSKPEVASVMEGSPAEKAGLAPGDRIVRVNGASVRVYEDLTFEMSSIKGGSIEIEFVRSGQRMKVVLAPFLDEATGVYKIGFLSAGRTGILGKSAEGVPKAGIFETLGQAFNLMVFFVKATVLGIVRLVTMQLSMSEMSGPIGIVGVIGDTYNATLTRSLLSRVLTMLELCGLLSANLGVFNLLPLPALDGGRLVFVLFEGIRRKPVPADKEGMVHLVGFVLLMILAVFVAVSDIRKML